MTLPAAALKTLPADSREALLSDPAVRLTCSQLGEDVAVFHLLLNRFRLQRPGFYVDVGAFHPRNYSNTMLLHLLGWSGINIEPSADGIQAFRRERPQDVNLQVGVAPDAGELTYYEFANSEASTFSAETAERWQRENGWTLRGTRIVPVRPLNDILAEHLPAGRRIDYMDIDVEGMDRGVVEALDFERFRPMILSVELNDADRLALGQDPTVMHLMRHRYELLSASFISYLFIDTTVTAP